MCIAYTTWTAKLSLDISEHFTNDRFPKLRLDIGLQIQPYNVTLGLGIGDRASCYRGRLLQGRFFLM